MCVCACMYVCVCVCLGVCRCMCVCVREKERERKREIEKEIERERLERHEALTVNPPVACMHTHLYINNGTAVKANCTNRSSTVFK